MANQVHVTELSLTELQQRRQEILASVGKSYEELATLEAANSLVGAEWAAWDDLAEIDYLMMGA